jgi:AraC-like DNA-binding protein
VLLVEDAVCGIWRVATRFVSTGETNGVTDTVSSPKLSTLVAAAGRDTDTAISSLAGLYAGRSWYSRSVDENFWFKYVGVGDEQVSVRRSQLHGYLRGDVATEDEVVVQWLDHGQARVDVGGDEIRMRPGVPVLFPVERRFEVEYQDWDQRLVHLRRDLVLEVASEQNLIAETLAFDNQVEPDAASVARWRTAVGGAVRALQTEGPSSLLWHEAQRDVARALLQLYPLHAIALPTGHSERSTARLRAAVDYIHAHAHQPLTVGDIAAAAGLSIRGLQEAFQRIFDQSPLTYVREVRLTRVHHELLALNPGTGRISDVARSWGFGHMGRFSGAYVQRFGEYPRQTLRRT